MIPVKDRVIIIEALPPDAHHPASIKWVTAETPDEGTDHYTDSDYTEVRVGFCILLLTSTYVSLLEILKFQDI